MVGRPKGPDKEAFSLRLDPQLMKAIRGTAEADLRSVTAQMEVLLREALKRRGVKVAPPGDAETALKD